MKQIKKLVARKKLQLMEKRPGAVYSGDPKIIYIRMLHRPMKVEQDQVMNRILSLTSKFNAILNDAVAELDQTIMTVISSSQAEHFDEHGNPTQSEQAQFWWEVNDLLQIFDNNKVKLVTNQRKGTAQASYAGNVRGYTATIDQGHQQREGKKAFTMTVH